MPLPDLIEPDRYGGTAAEKIDCCLIDHPQIIDSGHIENRASADRRGCFDEDQHVRGSCEHPDRRGVICFHSGTRPDLGLADVFAVDSEVRCRPGTDPLDQPHSEALQFVCNAWPFHENRDVVTKPQRRPRLDGVCCVGCDYRFMSTGVVEL